MIGESELAAGNVTLKDLKRGDRRIVARNEIAEIVRS